MESVLFAARTARVAGKHQEALERYVQAAILWPACKTEIRSCFVQSLTHVLDEMVAVEDPSSLPLFMKLVQSVFSLYARDPLVVAVLGTKCLNEGALKEAEFYLQTAVNLDPMCLIARDSLSAVCEQVVHRWHFHMLNDVGRNSAYFRAIHAAVGTIPDCSMLDIGSGTGILSMMAVRSGAKRVYACEVNETMATMSHDILLTNGMGDNVTILHCLSTDLSIPSDIPERVSLVVTETVDAGLLGEWIIPTLRHAWKELLLPRQLANSTNDIAACGHVIPSGATVYATLIECAEVRKQSRLLSDCVAGVSLVAATLEGTCCASSPHGNRYYKRGGQTPRTTPSHTPLVLTREPYTCERLSHVRGGYRELSETRGVLQFDFIDPEIPLPQGQFSLPITASGTLDAIAVWFHLHLDSTNTISTAPSQHTTWEQAIFPIAYPLRVSEGATVILNTSCSDTLISMDVEGVHRRERANQRTEASCCNSYKNGREHDCKDYVSSNRGTGDDNSEGVVTARDSHDSVYFVERGDLLRLNDSLYTSAYHRAIIEAVKSIRETSEAVDSAGCIVLDLTQGLSLFGLMAAKEGADFVHIAQTPLMYNSLMDLLINTNKLSESVSLRYQNVAELSRTGVQWDVLISDIVSPQGTLRSRVLEELGAIRSFCPHSLVLPSSLSLSIVLLSSPSLRARSSVLGTLPTLGFNVASHMNKYQVTHYTDVDLSTLPHQSLSSPTNVCTLTFNELGGEAPFLVDKTVSLLVTTTGTLTGIGYWFNLHLHGDITIDTGYVNDCDHWHQSVFVLTEDIQVSSGEQVTVHVAIRDSCLLLELSDNDHV